VFSHKDFDNFSNQSQGLSPENSDFGSFNLYTLSVAELIYLSNLDNEEERSKFFLSVMNLFFMSIEDIQSQEEIMDHFCDMILCLSLHVSLSVQAIEDKVGYIKMLNENLIPDISNKLNQK
jgi:hypothetical protein